MNKIKSKAFFGDGNGGVELREVELGPILDHQVLVKVKSFGLNRADMLQARGLYPPPQGESQILGLEFSGEVLGVGSKCSPDLINQRVMGLTASGAYSEYIIIDLNLLIPFDNSLSFEEAAAIPEAWVTAYFNLLAQKKISPGSKVLVHSAAGGVGLAAVQLARISGFDVIGVVGSKEKESFLNDLGVPETLNYKDKGYDFFQKQNKSAIGFVLDTIGPSLFDFHIEILRQGGHIQNIGLLGGVVGNLDMKKFLHKNLSIKSSTLRGQSLEVKAELCRDICHQVLPKILSGDLKVNLFKVFGSEDIIQAFNLMLSNEIIGKLVISW